MVGTVPTTTAGLVAFVDYVLAYPDFGSLVGDEGPAPALRSVSAALQAIGGGIHV